MQSLRQRQGKGSGKRVVFPLPHLGVVGERNDAYAYAVHLQLTQRTGIAIPLGGTGVAVEETQVVGTGGQEDAFVVQTRSAGSRVEPCLPVLYGIFRLLADAVGLQQVPRSGGRVLEGGAQAGIRLRPDGLNAVAVTTVAARGNGMATLSRHGQRPPVGIHAIAAGTGYRVPAQC